MILKKKKRKMNLKGLFKNFKKWQSIFNQYVHSEKNELKELSGDDLKNENKKEV